MKSESNLTTEEFHTALQKGLGRAYLYIQKYGDSKVRDSILYCCLHNTSYDPQCEGQRAEWLISIIDLTANQDFYFSKIIDALISCTDIWDVYQLFNLCEIIAKRNIQHAKIAIYRKFDLHEFNESFLGSYEIIDLDGLNGLRYVVQKLGQRLTEIDDFWVDGDVLDYAFEKFGRSQVSDYLKAESMTDRYIHKYLEQVKIWNQKILSRSEDFHTRKKDRNGTLERILVDVENSKYGFPYRYMRFGKYASKDEIEIIYQKFVGELRKEQIIRYLWIFWKREIPWLENKLFQLAMCDDKEIRIAAIRTLEYCQSTSIRDFAINLSKNPDNELALSSIGLFIKNYQLGDNQFIESVILRIKSEDEFTLHSICMDLIKIFKINMLDELLVSLLWAYEHTPCSRCRGKIVNYLIENSWMPKSLIDECLFDCVEDTRNLVKNMGNNPHIISS